MAEFITKDQVIDWFRCYGHMDKPIPYDVLVTDIQAMEWPDTVPVTNADRIRGVSDEELSEFINALSVCDCCVYDGICTEYNNMPKCRKGVLEWLQQPAEKPKEVPENETL